MLPPSWKTWVPRERSTPSSWYAAAPAASTTGTVASVRTLFTTVGRPNRPSIAGIGGLARTVPRLPSRLSSMEVSSPQMYAPAPTRTCRSKSSREPRMPVPSQPCSRAMPIAARIEATASGYSERM